MENSHPSLAQCSVLVIDLDGTITQPLDNWDGTPEDIAPPREGVQQALQHLTTLEYHLIISTCRTAAKASHPDHIQYEKTPEEKEHALRVVREYLDKHDIPYDKLWTEDKPCGRYYIDDRGIPFRGSWDEVLEQINDRDSRGD